VEIDKLDFDNIPFYPKPLDQIDEITQLLQKSFLTKNLTLDQVRKTAGAMIPRKFTKG
jgi:hypothetical protein